MLNVTLQYPRLAEPDEDSGKYSVQCVGMSEENAKKLVEIGLSPRHGKDRVDKDGNPKPTPEWGFYQTARTQFEFSLYDSSGKEIKGEQKEELLKVLGDGTRANVEVSSKPFKNAGNSGVSCFLRGIQIIALEEGTGGCSFGEVEGGFIAEPATVVEEDNIPFG